MADSFPPSGAGPSGASAPILAPMLARVVGNAIALTVGAVGVLLTLVVAAALAVFTVVASLMLALAGLGWRLGRGRTPAGGPVVLDARKVGHAWVAYGWDEPRA